MNTRDFSRAMRKHPTKEEARLWGILRNRQFHGCKFRRQHPIQYAEENGWRSSFIADFICLEKKLILEIDGGIHLGQPEYDEARQAFLEQLGFSFLRIPTSEFHHIDKVLVTLREALGMET